MARDLPADGDPESVSKVLFSFFLGFIVQSAMIGGIEAEIAAKGIEGLIWSHTGVADTVKK